VEASEPIVARLGRRLRDARQAAGLTVREAAASAGLGDHSILVRYENGQAAPPLERIAQLATAYGLTPAALLATDDAAVALIATIDRGNRDELARLLTLLQAMEEADPE
jgi:transcriptional regulator with XRE-family HTH domain